MGLIFGDLLRQIGSVVSVLFWGLVIGGLFMALTVPKRGWGKALAALAVMSPLLAFQGYIAWEKKQRRDAAQARETMFQERCARSGEFIHRTAEHVEGVFLLKLRGEMNKYNQYAMDDPYGDDSYGDGYIQTFLMARNEKGFLGEKVGGYRYVDAIDPKDGKRYRYTGRLDEPWKRNPRALEGHRVFVSDKALAPDPTPRYGVTYDDISTREERDYWIAGSSLRVIDLQTNEVMAERIGYMMDRGQGNNSGGRQPWTHAARNACPPHARFGQTRNFVEKVLHPKVVHLTQEK